MGLINVQLTDALLQELITAGVIDKPTFLQKLPMLKNHLGFHKHDSLTQAVQNTLSEGEQTEYTAGMVEGRAEYLAGGPITSNPHSPSSKPYRSAGWTRGWKRAEHGENF